ncbi:MAG: pitrilysin family protein [Eubacteriales bacterium]|nr:pitrilysin family protein [Eubacteriales bacterium]
MKKLYKFKNGLKLVYERLPYVRSVAVGVFVNTGSGNETAENNGISHFIEHMLFKGTATKSAFEIAESMEKIGADINAYTSKTNTCFYTVSIDEDFEKCAELLSDMYFNSVFSEEEMAREKGVVLEEIDMNEDDPSDVAAEIAAAKWFETNSLSRPILGGKNNVKSISREQIFEYMNDFYTADNTTVSVCGNLPWKAVYDTIKKDFSDKFSKKTKKIVKIEQSVGTVAQVTKFKKTEQGNVLIVFNGLKEYDPDTVALQILSSVFGGTMSGRLFQEVREKLGLAYSVYSYPSAYIEEGCYSVYIGTNSDNLDKAVGAVRREIDKLKAEGITEAEFSKGKAQLKSAFVFGQESSSTLMRLNGRYAMGTGTLFDAEKRMNEIDAVTLDDVKRVIERVFDFSRVVISYVGPKTEVDLTKHFAPRD